MTSSARHANRSNCPSLPKRLQLYRKVVYGAVGPNSAGNKLNEQYFHHKCLVDKRGRFKPYCTGNKHDGHATLRPVPYIRNVVAGLLLNQRDVLLEARNGQASLGNALLLAKLLGVDIVRDTLPEHRDGQRAIHLLLVAKVYHVPIIGIS